MTVPAEENPMQQSTMTMIDEKLQKRGSHPPERGMMTAATSDYDEVDSSSGGFILRIANSIIVQSQRDNGHLALLVFHPAGQNNIEQFYCGGRGG